MNPPPAFDRPTKRIMLGIMLTAYRAILVGDPAPITAATRNRMRNFLPGDLVIEHSIAYWLLYRDSDLQDSRWDGQFLRYVRTETEDLNDDEGNFWYTETYYVCLNPDGTEFRWTNADLLAVPDGEPVQY